MEKFLTFLKKNWQFLSVLIIAIFFLWDKIKSGFKSVFNPDAVDRSSDDSSASYLGSQTENKGVRVGSDGEEFFQYGGKRVRLTTANKAKVVDFVNTTYLYCSTNTNNLSDWLLNDDLHFNTPEIQATLNSYNDWCQCRETWVHYFAYIWLELHSVQFIDYLKVVLDATAYDATKHYVTNLSLYYY